MNMFIETGVSSGVSNPSAPLSGLASTLPDELRSMLDSVMHTTSPSSMVHIPLFTLPLSVMVFEAS